MVRRRKRRGYAALLKDRDKMIRNAVLGKNYMSLTTFHYRR